MHVAVGMSKRCGGFTRCELLIICKSLACSDTLVYSLQLE